MNKDILDPKVDFVFKQIFGSENNTDILIAFLNSVFKTKGTKDEIVTVKIENSEIVKDWEDDKLSRLDIKARTNDNSRINIEIQLKNQHNMKRRTLYYWSKLYESQIKSGEPYNNLERTVTINILNFTYLQENKRYHNAYVLKEKETNEVLTDLEEIHFIELTKFNEKQFKTVEDIERKSKEDELIPWALFLKNPNSEVMKMYKEKIKELKEAAVKLEVLSQDEEMRELYEGRQKWIHDYVTNLEGTAREARQAGIKEGKKKRDIELTIKMLKRGMPVSEIIELVSIDKEKINLIKEEIKH